MPAARLPEAAWAKDTKNLLRRMTLPDKEIGSVGMHGGEGAAEETSQVDWQRPSGAGPPMTSFTVPSGVLTSELDVLGCRRGGFDLRQLDHFSEPPPHLRSRNTRSKLFLPQRMDMKRNQKSGAFASGIGYSERPRNLP
jgi:hypothetical protein